MNHYLLFFFFLRPGSFIYFINSELMPNLLNSNKKKQTLLRTKHL
jgi:hypothetical protein